MAFETIGGHTFNPSKLKDGVIIDIGCRDFSFADHFPNKKVYCVDVDPKVFEGHNKENQVNINCAISNKSGQSGYYENGEATCLKEIDPDQNHPFKPCVTITMDELYEITGTNVDLLKLDCEGAEYIILGEGFKPIPKQISVEFHHHCVPDMHKEHYSKIIERLSKDYDMHNDVWEQRHGCGFNFWDTLFVRRW
jgi:FkbM family methyltransferase